MQQGSMITRDPALSEGAVAASNSTFLGLQAAL